MISIIMWKKNLYLVCLFALCFWVITGDWSDNYLHIYWRSLQIGKASRAIFQLIPNPNGGCWEITSIKVAQHLFVCVHVWFRPKSVVNFNNLLPLHMICLYKVIRSLWWIQMTLVLDIVQKFICVGNTAVEVGYTYYTIGVSNH
jgi:hypothetical protein